MARSRRPASSPTTTCSTSSPTSARPPPKPPRRLLRAGDGDEFRRRRGGHRVRSQIPGRGFTPTNQEEPTMEYLVTMTTHVPDGTPDQAVADVRAREAAHSRELAAAGDPLA